MFFRKAPIALYLLFFSPILISQHSFQAKDDLIIDGRLDLNNLVYTALDKQLGDQPATSIEITFKAPLMKDTKKLVSNLGHIPMLDDVDPYDDSTKVDASIMVPFKSSGFTNDNGVINIDSFVDSIATSMGQFTGASTDQFEKDLDHTDPNCSGMPVGTTFNTRTTNCFGTTDNTYECQTVNGQNNWILTINIFIPSEGGCYPGGD